MEVAGQMVQGGQNIFFAQLADSANVAHFSADATRYFSGEFTFYDLRSSGCSAGYVPLCKA